ncbi:MAG: hypothetical protein ACYCZX_02590 [Rhodospirillaceae bacterium]
MTLLRLVMAALALAALSAAIPLKPMRADLPRAPTLAAGLADDP